MAEHYHRANRVQHGDKSSVSPKATLRSGAKRGISQRLAELSRSVRLSSHQRNHERQDQKAELSHTSCRTKTHAHQGRGPSKRWPVLFGLGAAVVVIGIVSYLILGVVFPAQQQSENSVAAGQQVTVTISEGTGGRAIAQLLLDDGVISDASEFLSTAQKQNADSEFKPGTYSFVTGSAIQNVIDQLIAGPNTSANSITVTEGLTLSQTAALVQEDLGISADDFTAQAKASNYVSDYPFLEEAVASGSDSLEGYLYPKTYDFSGQDISADTVIRAMLDQYQKEVASLDFSGAEQTLQSTYGLTISDYDIVKLASIVEKEALTDEQRPKIASVFFNRLKAGMFLESDATMGYVTGGSVTANDLKTDSPYNTYLYAGLTPTPICSPSLSSIQAVLSPATTDYYYFWITSTEEVFSETYEEHQQAIAASQAS
jgi:UPF0755 protein